MFALCFLTQTVRLLSLLNLNFRAEYTFKSRMCCGIVGDGGTSRSNNSLRLVPSCVVATFIKDKSCNPSEGELLKRTLYILRTLNLGTDSTRYKGG